MRPRILRTPLLLCAFFLLVGEAVGIASRPIHLSLARAELQTTLCYPNPPRLAWLVPARIRAVPMPSEYLSAASTHGPLGFLCRRSTLCAQPEGSHLPEPHQNGVACSRTPLVLPFTLVIDSDGASIFSSSLRSYGREVCSRDLLLVVGSWSFTLGHWHTGSMWHGGPPRPGTTGPAA